jgi:hypothetical protein
MAPLSSGVEETFACAKCTFAYPVFQPFAAGTASGSSAMLPCSQVVALGAPQCWAGRRGEANTPRPRASGQARSVDCTGAVVAGTGA